jgi:Transglycosylase
MAKKAILKAFKYFTIALRAVMACIYLVIEVGGYVKTTSEEREQMEQMFSEAPALPQNFLDVCEKVYPGALNSTMWGYVFKEGFDVTDFKYPIRDAAVTYCIHKANGSFWNIALMAFLIEDYATPQQCLQFNLEHFDFTHNNIGVEAASQYHYKKAVKDLTDDEVLEILVMYRNPTLYDRLSTNPKKRALSYKSFDKLKASYSGKAYKFRI